MDASGRPAEATMSAVVTRADGTVEDLGVIAYWHHSWLRRMRWRFRRHFLTRS